MWTGMGGRGAKIAADRRDCISLPPRVAGWDPSLASPPELGVSPLYSVAATTTCHLCPRGRGAGAPRTAHSTEAGRRGQELPGAALELRGLTSPEGWTPLASRWQEGLPKDLGGCTPFSGRLPKRSPSFLASELSHKGLWKPLFFLDRRVVTPPSRWPCWPRRGLRQALALRSFQTHHCTVALGCPPELHPWLKPWSQGGTTVRQWDLWEVAWEEVLGPPGGALEVGCGILVFSSISWLRM